MRRVIKKKIQNKKLLKMRMRVRMITKSQMQKIISWRGSKNKKTSKILEMTVKLINKEKKLA